VTAEIERAISTQAREPGGGLIVMPDTFNVVHRQTIIALAARYSLPTIYYLRYFATDGGRALDYLLIRRTLKHAADSSTDQGGGKRREEAVQSRLPFFWWLPPFPFTGVPVVTGDTALDHFVAPAVSLNNKRDAVAAAKADGPERHHNADLQQQLTHEEPSQAVGVAPLCKVRARCAL
jgi:hypothetical protein